MAALGNIGINRNPAPGGAPTTFHRFQRGLWVNGDVHRPLTKDTVEGNFPPSGRVAGPGTVRFRVPVDPGPRTLSIQVRFSPNLAPYPSLRVPKNASVGMSTDLVATAVAGTGYQVLSVSWSASAKGAVWVELWANLPRPDALTNWDNFSYT